MQQVSEQPREGVLEPPRVLQELVEEVGVRFNGNAPWDIRVHDPQLYNRILRKGSLGFGEAYMEGLWDCPALDELFTRLLSLNIEQKLRNRKWARLLGTLIHQRLFNLQSSSRAYQVGERHYDIGNDVFEAMLDSSMSYSCGYWHNADTLEQAQWNKLEMVCRKLELKPGERLLDIGCGWGGLAHHAAKYYDVEVEAVTISKEQRKFAQERCAGLPVTINLKDYRELSGSFDKAVSIGMFEHVGPKNYAAYFDIILRVLKEKGLFLLHTIGIYKTIRSTDAWINKYIFPNGKLPSAKEISSALNGRFLIEDWHNFGQDYDRTLMAWWERFNRAWPGLAEKYDERFYRMWRYYLACCAGLFRSRQGQLWQLVLSKRSRSQTYRSFRLNP